MLQVGQGGIEVLENQQVGLEQPVEKPLVDGLGIEEALEAVGGEAHRIGDGLDAQLALGELFHGGTGGFARPALANRVKLGAHGKELAVDARPQAGVLFLAKFSTLVSLVPGDQVGEVLQEANPAGSLRNLHVGASPAGPRGRVPRVGGVSTCGCRLPPVSDESAPDAGAKVQRACPNGLTRRKRLPSMPKGVPRGGYEPSRDGCCTPCGCAQCNPAGARAWESQS